jgi:hypothetical protein
MKIGDQIFHSRPSLAILAATGENFERAVFLSAAINGARVRRVLMDLRGHLNAIHLSRDAFE